MSLVFNPFTSNFDDVSDLTVLVGASPNANASTVTSAGTSITLTLQPASASFPGILLSTDWNLFNNKANASLNNLSAVAINTSLVLGIDTGSDLGSLTKRWGTTYTGAVTFNGNSFIDLNQNFIADNSSNPSIKFNNRILVGNDGTTNSVAWGAQQLQTGAGTVKLDWSGTNLDINTRKITSVVDPTNPQDVATKNYVDTTGGTVTSVALADGSSTPIYTISGSPVTTSGTLTLTLSTQSANRVFAGPTTGAAAQPTFRAIVAADLPVSNLTDAGTDGIVITGGTGAVIGAGTSIAQHVADTTHNGYLSSTDWNTFNGKQAAGNYITALTGDVTASGPGSVAATLATVNANVGTFASVTVNGKGLVTAATALSGDATTSGAALTLATVNANTGTFGSSTAIPQFTVNGKGLITAASTNVVIAPAGTLTGTTLAANVVSSSLTSVGTITTGVWNGTTIDIAHGGTGQVTKAAAFDALSPMTTGGDLIYGGASGTGTRLANGTAGQALLSGGGTAAPTWGTPTVAASFNYAPNTNFQWWQAIEATATTIANTVSTYGPDQWYGKNSLGTNGVLTISQVAAVNAQSKFGCKLQVTTAPTAAQTNGTELYCILGNNETIPLLGQVVSAGIQVKAFGNVNQVGVEIFYATTRTKLTTSLGSEGTATVNTSTFTSVSSLNTTLTSGTITASGVVGFRVRITGVSTGNTYDLNNGFVVELPGLNVGSSLATWGPRSETPQLELLSLQRYYWKTFPQGTTPAQNAGTTGCAIYGETVANSGQSAHVIFYPTILDATPTVTTYNPSAGNNKIRNTSTGVDWGSTSVNSNFVNTLQLTGSSDSGSSVGQGGFVHITADARI